MQIFLRSLRYCHFYKHLINQNPPSFLSSRSHSPFPLIRCLEPAVFSSPSGFISCYSASSSQRDFEFSNEGTETESIHQQKKTNVVQSTLKLLNSSKPTEQQWRSAKKKQQAKKMRPQDVNSALQEIQGLRKETGKSEGELRVLKRNPVLHPQEEKKYGVEAYQPKTKSLYSLFSAPSPSGKKSQLRRKNKSRPSGKRLDELSPEFLSFLRCLHEEGYLKDANCLKNGELDRYIFSHDYLNCFVKPAAERFGYKHQEIAKYLRGSDLKKIALFGCPTAERKTVFAAKGLRSFFNIEEDTVCWGCKLNSVCKFKNQRVEKKKNLDLMDALKVLTSYTLEDVRKSLVVSHDMKLSINKLLKEVVNLSQ